MYFIYSFAPDAQGSAKNSVKIRISLNISQSTPYYPHPLSSPLAVGGANKGTCCCEKRFTLNR